jgi:hypothetical protein
MNARLRPGDFEIDFRTKPFALYHRPMFGRRLTALVVALASVACGAGSEAVRAREVAAERKVAFRRLACVVAAETSGCTEGERYDGTAEVRRKGSVPWSLVCREGRAYGALADLQGEVGAGVWEALGRVTRASGGCIAFDSGPVRASAFPRPACAGGRQDVHGLVSEALGTMAKHPTPEKRIAEDASESWGGICEIDPRACTPRDPVCPAADGDVVGWARP